jgi:hypothetical protein
MPTMWTTHNFPNIILPTLDPAQATRALSHAHALSLSLCASSPSPIPPLFPTHTCTLACTPARERAMFLLPNQLGQKDNRFWQASTCSCIQIQEGLWQELQQSFKVTVVCNQKLTTPYLMARVPCNPLQQRRAMVSAAPENISIDLTRAKHCALQQILPQEKAIM